MAKPIEFRPMPSVSGESRGSRERLEQRLREAPLEHGDAMLAAYDLLQQMHDSGTLDLMRGALGAGDKIVEEVSAMLALPETIRGIRNFILLSKIMATISPEVLERVIRLLPASEEQQVEEKPPSLFALARRLFSAESRRGLAYGVIAAETVGKASKPQPKNSGAE